MNGIRQATACFITRADFTTCGNLRPSQQVADHVHAVHQRPFNHVERPRGLDPRYLDIIGDVIGDAVHERMFKPLFDRRIPPGEIGFLLLSALPTKAFGKRKQPLGGIGAARQHRVLAASRNSGSRSS